MTKIVRLLVGLAILLLAVGLILAYQGQRLSQKLLSYLPAPQPITAIDTTSNPAWQAKLIEQSPTIMVSFGQNRQLYARFQNTGTATWTHDDPHPVRFGLVQPQVTDSPLHTPFWAGRDRPTNLFEETVEPGGIGTFEFSVYGNRTPPGIYRQGFGLVAENAAWLGGTSQIKWEIYVVPNIISANFGLRLEPPLTAINSYFLTGKLLLIVGMAVAAVATILQIIGKTLTKEQKISWPLLVGQAGTIIAGYLLAGLALLVLIIKEPEIWLRPVSSLTLIAFCLLIISWLGLAFSKNHD